MSDRDTILKRWEGLLEGITDSHLAYQTARLFENQAKEFVKESGRMDEETLTPGATTVGKIGTFQKWAFPMIRRMYPELIFNKIGATQAMEGPVSQIFYMGNSRSGNNAGTYTTQTMYSMFKVTPLGLVASSIGSVSSPGTTGTWGVGTDDSLAYQDFSGTTGVIDVSNVIRDENGSPSSTFGGKLASFPDSRTILGWNVSAAERLVTSGIPEVTMHIQKQTVQARERKMRALWTLEAAQDLKAYHNLDMEAELTDLLSKEMNLEIDRELIEDVRMIAYGFETVQGGPGGWALASLFNGHADNFPAIGGNGPNNTAGFTPVAYQYDFGDLNADLAAETAPNTSGSNIYVMDLSRFTTAATAFAPQHLGHAYSNVLALINFASQDIYRTTLRGPGTVLITSPLIATLLESAAKLEGGIPRDAAPTNTGGQQISYVGKFCGKYDLIVDPLFPEDEIIVGYKGSGPMDAGLFYCPYIPIMPLDKVVDPESFQPRKGILTRYGKVAVQPASRFYRVIRLVGAGPDFITKEIFKQNKYYGADTGGGVANSY